MAWPTPRNFHEIVLIGQLNAIAVALPLAMAETRKVLVRAMGRWKKDRRLNEVKAILRRLQHIATDPDPADLANASGAGAPPMSGPTHLTIAAMVATVVAVLGLVATYGLVSFRQPTDPTENRAPTSSGAPTEMVSRQSDAASPPSPLAGQVLQSALQQMASGRIQTARGQLLPIASEGSADAAWSLARSYDPNYLATIPSADAAADVEEATRWYQIWHTIAVKEGLVADSISLERIIRSMRQPPAR
jgi:hypothetical protein